MSDSEPRPSSKPLFVLPGRGRKYEMGGMSALFLADEGETSARYSISEWWLEPHTQGPGAHSHAEDDVFFVLEGTMSFLLGDEWVDAPKGSFVLAPGGVVHDFENRSDGRAGALNLSFPGGFEANMGEIVRWFAEQPPGRAG
ncbi:MAG TPA: cupin domain-containing protein [Polyangiaceae bacterium]|nr:cupin domain-containing protein [Polyangiaceae bacterium]